MVNQQDMSHEHGNLNSLRENSHLAKQWRHPELHSSLLQFQAVFMTLKNHTRVRKVNAIMVEKIQPLLITSGANL